MTAVNGPAQRPQTDFEDDVPTGITHLPEKSQPWAWGLHRAVRDMRDEMKKAKWALRLVPFVTAGLIGLLQLVGYWMQAKGKP